MFKRILIALLCTLTVTSSMTGCIDQNSTEDNSGSESVSTTEKENSELTSDEALEIAKEYWRDHDIEKNGYIIAEAVSKDAPDSVYVFVLKRLVEIEGSTHYSTIDEVWVDRFTGEAVPPYDAKPGLMFDYDEVLWCYKYAVDYYNYEDRGTVDDLIDDFNTKYGKEFLNETEKQWFAEIAVSGYILYPGKYGDHRIEYNRACGYATNDLNGDGIEELVLLNADYTLVAIFSMKDGRPILLTRFWNRCKGWIDQNGYIHVGGSNGADSGSRTIYRICEGGGGLELLYEYGRDGYEWVDDVAVTKYYKMENGEKAYITEEEYDYIDEQYNHYLGDRDFKEVTRKDSGLQFKSLFGEAFTFSTYGNVLDTMRFMTGMYNLYKIGEAKREDFEYRYDLSTEYNREMYKKLDSLVRDWYPPALGASSPAEDAFAYAIKDLNGDGVDELVIIDGERIDAVAIMTEKDGKIEVYDTAYSFDCPAKGKGKSHRLYYWKNTVGLDILPLYPESDYFSLDALRLEARYMIESVLAGGVFADVWLPIAEEHIQLADYVAMTPSGEKRIGDIEDLKYAFVDMDSDGIEELLIDCGAELVVLYKSFGGVYLYSLDHRQISSLNSDGSFSWNSTGEDHEYGESRITWLNLAGIAEIETIWRIVNDGEPDAEYYIGETQVTAAEMQKYLAENKKTKVEFAPLEEIYGDAISPLEAVEIGSEYWQDPLLSDKNLSVIINYYAQFDKVPFDMLDEIYIVQLVRLNSDGLVRYVHEILVDRSTGAYTVTVK
ncbi:MAG: hypothetical protein IJ345_00615 [Clostridia bacterium]|nr:hypothetical protein [Clostridia bacterium]